MPNARISIPVIGLGCGGGGALQLELALARLRGVDGVYVNAATETAYIEYDPSAVPAEALVEEMRRAGYRPGQFSPDLNLAAAGRGESDDPANA